MLELFVTQGTDESSLMKVTTRFPDYMAGIDEKITGNIIVSEREEDIFKILGVPWQEPHERVRG